METRTRDLLFGTGRGADGLRGVFAPRAEPVKLMDVVATVRSERFANALEQRGLITAEQRAGQGVAARGAEELVDLAGSTTRGLAGGAGAAAGVAATGTPQYANPIYNGLMAQQLMRDHGFVAPTAPPDGVILAGGAADDVRLVAATVEPAADVATAATSAADSPIVAAADDMAAAMEQRLINGLQRMSEMAPEYKISALQQTVDATAAHGGDSYDVLSRAMLERPLDDVVVAFERSLDDLDALAKVPVAPVVDDAVKVVAPVVDDVATAAAPVIADTVAEVVTKAVPQVVEAALPKVVAAAQPSLLLAGSDDALRGVMSFSAGIDDTLRLLAKF